MNYSLVNDWEFFSYLIGCFMAVMLSLHHKDGNRLLPQFYGAWIASAYAAHHLLLPHAAQTWHYGWYLWNGYVISLFPVILAYRQKDADARLPVMVFGLLTVALCSVYAFFSWLGQPLPGVGYYLGASIFEAIQVLSMIIWSGPVVPLFRKLIHHLTERKDTWMRRVLT